LHGFNVNKDKKSRAPGRMLLINEQRIMNLACAVSSIK
jgi:hypothetical protein